MNKLGGASFLYNGITQDYCYKETIECLAELCDEVSICIGGTDGCVEDILDFVKKYPEGKIKIIVFTEEDWNAQQGREKLSYFSNIAISSLDTEYVWYMQMDEIVHELSFQFIRQAIETGAEGFLVSRINLWSSPYMMLNVPHDRKPCSTEIIRLTRTKYRCIDDAESIGIPNWPNVVSFEFIDMIRIYHMGFVRDKHKHLTKIKHIQEDVFLMDVDKRINDNQDGFDPWKWGFTPEDIVPIPDELPKFIRQWAEERK